MPSFRLSSQSSFQGGKAMGGLRGSSKIGTSNSNKRAQSRRAYGDNFFFSMNPAPTGLQVPDGSYLLAHRDSSSSSSNSIQPLSPSPATLMIFSTSSDGVQTLEKVDIGIQVFTWNSVSQRYETSDNTSDPYFTVSYYHFDYNSSLNTYDATNLSGYAGTVYTIPGGQNPDLNDAFYLYTLDESGNKTYIYSTNTPEQSSSTESLLLTNGVPIDENGISVFDICTLNQLTCKYTYYLHYPNAPYNPVKYFATLEGGLSNDYLDFSAEPYVTLKHPPGFGNYVQPTPASLDPNYNASGVNQGARYPYDVEAFECNLVPPSRSTEEQNLFSGAKVYKEKVVFDYIATNGNNLKKYLITWYDPSAEPQYISASQDSSGNRELVYQIGDDTTTLPWVENNKNYSIETTTSTNTMTFSKMPDDNNGTTYFVNSNNNGTGVVVPLPSGPPLDDIFTLYSTDSSNNKQYVYFNKTVSSGNSYLVLGEPTGDNASDYTIAEFKVMYDKRKRYYRGTRIPLKYYSITNNPNSSTNYVYFSSENFISVVARVGYGEFHRDFTSEDLDPNYVNDNGARKDYGVNAFNAYFVPPSLDTSPSSLMSAAIYKEQYVAPSTTIEGTHSDGYIAHRSGNIKNAVSEEILATIQTDEAGKYSTSILSSKLPEVMEVVFDGEDGKDIVTGETHKTEMSLLISKEELLEKGNNAHVTYMTTMCNELCKEEKEIVKADTTLTEEEKAREIKDIDMAKQLKMVECFDVSMETLKEDIIELEDIKSIEASQKIHAAIEGVASAVENSPLVSQSDKEKMTRKKITQAYATKIKDTKGQLSMSSSTNVSSIITILENDTVSSIPSKSNLSKYIANTISEIEVVMNDANKSFTEKASSMAHKSKGLRESLKSEVQKTDSKLKPSSDFTTSDFDTMKGGADVAPPTSDDFKAITAKHILVSKSELTSAFANINAGDILNTSEFTGLQDGQEFPTLAYMAWIKENVQSEERFKVSVKLLLDRNIIRPETSLSSSEVMEKVNSLFSADNMSDWAPFKVTEKTRRNCVVRVMGGSFTDPFYEFEVMSQKMPLMFDVRKTYTFKRMMSTHPFYIKDLEDPTRISISGDGSSSSGIMNRQSFTIEFKPEFDPSSDKLIYYCTSHNDMVKSWSDQKMYYRSNMAREYSILAKRADGERGLSQWILNMDTNKLVRKSYDNYWEVNGIPLWEASEPEPVIDETPVEEPLSLKEKVILRWLELEMEGEIKEVIFTQDRFTQDINNAAYGSKRGAPIKVVAMVNNEERTHVFSRNIFIELREKYESAKSKEKWDTDGTKMQNDTLEFSFSGVVSKSVLEGGYWFVMPDDPFLQGQNTPSPMLLVNWDKHMDFQVEGTRVTGTAVLIPGRVSFMTGEHVFVKTMDYEVSTN